MKINEELEVLVRILDGQDITQIAEALDRSKGHVSQMISYAVSQLRSIEQRLPEDQRLFEQQDVRTWTGLKGNLGHLQKLMRLKGVVVGAHNNKELFRVEVERKVIETAVVWVEADDARQAEAIAINNIALGEDHRWELDEDARSKHDVEIRDSRKANEVAEEAA